METIFSLCRRMWTAQYCYTGLLGVISNECWYLTLTKNRDNYTVLCTCSVEDLSGLKHEAADQLIGLYKALPRIWRVGTKQHFNK